MKMEEVGIVNDMPKGWTKGKDQPLWHRKVYDMWRQMWSRCKNSNDKYYNNYKDCEVYKDFKYLSKYIEWITNEPRFKEFTQTCNKVKWCIDKDIKDSNNRNYYPKYMMLTTGSENSKERANRKGIHNPKIPLIAIDKSNKILLFKSTLDVRDKGFNRCAVSQCINKKRKTHKGYKWYKVNYKHNLRLRKNK